jgi:hypothetical protein
MDSTGARRAPPTPCSIFATTDTRGRAYRLPSGLAQSRARPTRKPLSPPGCNEAAFEPRRYPLQLARVSRNVYTFSDLFRVPAGIDADWFRARTDAPLPLARTKIRRELTAGASSSRKITAER